MIRMRLAEIADATGGVVIGPDGAPADGAPADGAPADAAASTSVTGGVVIDSREAEEGSLFVALPGEHVDGHDYVATAIARGAASALVARPVPGVATPLVQVPDVQRALGDLARHVLSRLRLAADVRVVAITGSVGKTSTKDLLAQLLTPLGGVIAPVGSFNNEIGLPLTVLRADRSTRVLVLEMGADAPGNITYLTAIAPPDVAVVLAVGSAHLGRFGSVDAIAAAKAELVQGLRQHGLAVLNADDARVAAMAPLAAGERVVTFGKNPDADVRAVGVSTDAEGHASFTLLHSGARADVTLALFGEHHVANALAAVAVAVELGRPLAEVARTLATAAALSAHRMHVVDTPGGVRVIDDAYNANPDSTRAALEALAVMTGRDRRSVAVLGEMLELGEASGTEHDAIGRLVVRLDIARLVVVGAGAYPIHTGARREGAQGEVSTFVETIEDAWELLRTELRPGDVVLVKSSKGAGLARLGDQLTTLGQAT
ncbi:MAG: UDP-N-acetylmuramoyl-tripeptide--D-alanyl-D-alanine ligase [Actinomycetales bacterium]|nr:UDP-N-acetylmuramoyl-tripeptide--D-alanyl-D-alanine ligase [Actinomycetales bacterium]